MGRDSNPAWVVASVPEELVAEFSSRSRRIEVEKDALLDTPLTEKQTWARALGAPPKDAKIAATWRRPARIVAAYRDRYGITDPTPLGTSAAEDDAQKIDAARAKAALDRARSLARGAGEEPQRRPEREPVRRAP